MGFFDFLKRKDIEKEIKKELSIPEIKLKISEENRAVGGKSLKLKEQTGFLINGIISSLKTGLVSLELINLNKRKEDERLKNIVKENINVYISHLEKLITELESLDKNLGFEDYLAKIKHIFGSFSRNSAKNLEKATILVGSEFEQIQRNFRDFSKEFNKIVEEELENKKKKEKLNKLSQIFQDISEIEKSGEQVKNLILRLDSEKKQKESEILKKNKEVKDLKESEAYKNDLEERRKINVKIDELDKKIQLLQEKINLKELARKYHSDEKKHKIIQKFIDNFKQAMEEDEAAEFAKIVKEARGFDINLEEISKKRKTLSSYASQSEIKIKEIENEIEKIKDEVDGIEDSREQEEKKLGKFKEKTEVLIAELKAGALDLGW